MMGKRLFFIITLSLFIQSFFFSGLYAKADEIVYARPGLRSKLAIVSISAGNAERETFTRYTFEVLRKYARNNGYDLHLYARFLEPFASKNSIGKGAQGAWSKISAVKDVLDDVDHAYEWVVWIDDDILLTNLAKQLESFIQACNPQVDLITSRDYTPDFANQIMSTGFFLLRRSEWSYGLLNRIIEIGIREALTNPFMEQNAINEIYQSQGNDFGHIEVLPIRTLQSFSPQSSIPAAVLAEFEQRNPSAIYQNTNGLWQPGDFSIHMVQMSSAARVACIKEILNGKQN
jgi:hypothetical protein